MPTVVGRVVDVLIVDRHLGRPEDSDAVVGLDDQLGAGTELRAVADEDAEAARREEAPGSV
jgi:hypothetical protein